MITAARKISDSATNEIRCSNYTGWPTSSICTSSTKKSVVYKRRCGLKHCKRRENGATKKKERPNPTHRQQPQGHVSNHNQKQEQHVWDLCPDEPRDVVYIQQHTTTEGAVANREGERVHLLDVIVVTAPVFQVDTSWLNADAR